MEAFRGDVLRACSEAAVTPDPRRTTWRAGYCALVRLPQTKPPSWDLHAGGPAESLPPRTILPGADAWPVDVDEGGTEATGATCVPPSRVAGLEGIDSSLSGRDNPIAAMSTASGVIRTLRGPGDTAHPAQCHRRGLWHQARGPAGLLAAGGRSLLLAPPSPQRGARHCGGCEPS